jgi:hypothetical protein
MKNYRLYIPHENQRIVHVNEARNRVLVAGRRFGKSALGLNEAIGRASLMENQIIWIVLPLYRQAKEIYWIDPDITKYFMPMVLSGAVKADKSELSLHFLKNNSWVRLKGSDNYDSLRGSGIDLVIWDEAADIKQGAFETIEPALADSPSHRQLFIGTPKGLNHFHDMALRGDHDNKFPTYGKPIKPKKDWISWHFTSYENMAWAEGSKEKKSFIQYIDDKRKDADEAGRLGNFNQEYMASFEESAGRFFPTWSPRTHVYNGTIIPKSDFAIYESMDWGRTAPFAWHAHVLYPTRYYKDEDIVNFNRIYTFAELYGTGRSPYEWVKEIVEVRKTFKILETKEIVVDPSMFDNMPDGARGIKDQMNQAFEQFTGKRELFSKGTRNRKTRWAVFDNWLRNAIDGIPYWMITKDCPNLARTIPLMEPNENDIEDLNTDLEDHAVDGVSYFLPVIKWIDSGKLGTIDFPIPDVSQIKPPPYIIDPGKFVE